MFRVRSSDLTTCAEGEERVMFRQDATVEKQFGANDEVRGSKMEMLDRPRLTSASSPQLSSRTPTHDPSTSDYGVSNPLNERTARSPTIDTASSTANEPSATRDTSPPTKATLHLHATHNPLRRQLLHPTDHEPTACIPERKGHTELAAMESEFTEATECRGG